MKRYVLILCAFLISTSVQAGDYSSLYKTNNAIDLEKIFQQADDLQNQCSRSVIKQDCINRCPAASGNLKTAVDKLLSHPDPMNGSTLRIRQQIEFSVGSCMLLFNLSDDKPDAYYALNQFFAEIKKEPFTWPAKNTEVAATPTAPAEGATSGKDYGPLVTADGKLDVQKGRDLYKQVENQCKTTGDRNCAACGSFAASLYGKVSGVFGAPGYDDEKVSQTNEGKTWIGSLNRCRQIVLTNGLQPEELKPLEQLAIAIWGREDILVSYASKTAAPKSTAQSAPKAAPQATTKAAPSAQPSSSLAGLPVQPYGYSNAEVTTLYNVTKKTMTEERQMGLSFCAQMDRRFADALLFNRGQAIQLINNCASFSRTAELRQTAQAYLTTHTQQQQAAMKPKQQPQNSEFKFTREEVEVYRKRLFELEPRINEIAYKRCNGRHLHRPTTEMLTKDYFRVTSHPTFPGNHPDRSKQISNTHFEAYLNKVKNCIEQTRQAGPHLYEGIAGIMKTKKNPPPFDPVRNKNYLELQSDYEHYFKAYMATRKQVYRDYRSGN
ncbi:hypothetical protein [Sneathiella limimaris]|uniref:hypothetical protein n=1 Tax=Sneathiella limimaris TaxID=1964213 RepID=UPI00146AFE2E|nr:hypothetical protein [Sneathiella limimaris]